MFLRFSGNNNLDFIRKQLREKKKNDVPMMMALFPEGTRYTFNIHDKFIELV